MFSFRRKPRSPDPVALLHERLVAASRAPALFGPAGLPDTVEGRFESLTLHALLVLRRLRRLPAPAGEVAQELVDAVFAHLEIALRETGVGDFGVPKRMKKLARSFYDRVAVYDSLLDLGQPQELADELRRRVAGEGHDMMAFARYCLASEHVLRGCDLEALLAGPPFSFEPASHGGGQ